MYIFFICSTKSLATVFNHFALHRLHKNVLQTTYINESIALKLHFKTHCPAELVNECNKLQHHTILDTSLLSLKKEVSLKVNITLKKLKNLLKDRI